LARLRSTN